MINSNLLKPGNLLIVAAMSLLALALAKPVMDMLSNKGEE